MDKYTANQIKNWDVSCSPYWLPARPKNYRVDGVFMRLKLAWRVLIGRYDALDWQEATDVARAAKEQP